MSYYTKITKAGLAAITAAMNNNSKVPITYMAFGDGNGYIPEPDENATSLVNEVYRVGVNKVEVHNKNPNWLVCEAIIPSAVGGFNIREVALYDNTGNTMLAIASYPPTYKPTVEEGAAKIQTIRIVIQVDNSGNFELIVDPDVVLATVDFVNNKLGTLRVNKISDLFSILNPQNGMIVEVVSYDENVARGGGYFIYDDEKANDYNGATYFYGWKRLSVNLDIFDFGAINNSDSTQKLQDASYYSVNSGNKIILPEGTIIQADNCNFDSSNFIGYGSLLFKNHNRIMTYEYRKGANVNGIITLEDEFGQHIDENKRYSAFGCSALINGKEYLAVRCAKNHYYDANTPSSLVLYIIDRNTGEYEKQILITSNIGHDIRDVNISVLPEFGNKILIKYCVQISSNSFEAYIIAYNCHDNIIENIRQLIIPSDQYIWGNTLITPSGYLLTASYGLNGSCRLYRSTIEFNYNSNDNINLNQVAQFESADSAEPTICYYDDKLICFWRMKSGTNGRYNNTYNLEGNSGWGSNVGIGREVHAPYVDPYNFNKQELIMMCSLGNARSIIATFATQNLDYWYSTARLLVAGNTTLAAGQSGGYPSFVDYGENLSVQSYADFRHSDMTLTSRLDVRLVKKSLYSAFNSYAAQRLTYNNTGLNWGEYSLGTSAATIDIAIGLKRQLSVTTVRLRVTGVSNNTFVEILNSGGGVVATSAVVSINTTTYQDVEFILPSTSLTAGNYTIRIQRKDTANPLIFNWNNSGFIKKRIIKNKTFDIIGLKSSSSATLWNNAGIHVDLY